MQTTYGYNAEYLTKDNKPWFPIMGEIHYTRVNRDDWLESLYKMKACGVQVISTYTFWIHHEEMHGVYKFDDNHDLRAFTEAVAEVGLEMFLRVGPWCHGEVRNGGFPDWLLDLPFEPRTNNQGYLDEVKKFYEVIYNQVRGLFHKDGGPIIGLQIENEYGHAGGLNGKEGHKHMMSLRSIAEDIGFEVPYYTATGWGGAMTGDMIPVMGGYCEAPWDSRVTLIEPSGNYIFTYERNDHNIGSDYGFGEGITFDIEQFPYLTAELGGGLQVTYHRRPKATGKDISAMSLAKLGSGVNLLGYYMYHGGTNPKGQLTTLQESKATGAPNDYPILNYDFQAPIRQYGQVSETARELKLWAYFTHDFGEDFCLMPALIPENNPKNPSDLTHLRYAYRTDGNRGYIFVNNYQKDHPMSKHEKVVLSADTSQGIIEYKPCDIDDKDFYFWPFNMPIGDGLLRSAMATPLCSLGNMKGQRDHYFFYTEAEPNYDFAVNPSNANVVTLTRTQAKNSWKIQLDREYLLICDGVVLDQNHQVSLYSRGDVELISIPPLPEILPGYECIEVSEKGAMYNRPSELTGKVNWEKVENSDDGIESYDITYDIPVCHDAFLQIHYVGDQAKLLDGDCLVADHFYYGEVWEVSMKALGYPKQLRLVIEPLFEDMLVYMPVTSVFENGKSCQVIDISIEVEEKTVLLVK